MYQTAKSETKSVCIFDITIWQLEYFKYPFAVETEDRLTASPWGDRGWN